jgi:diguanylate cyclase (GGDEF)-like protein
MDDNILVVDDDPGAIQLLGRILEGLGSLRFATNGTDAVRLARESTPDLILLDAEMPGMSGFKVFDALKAIPNLADIPVIFVTSHAESAFEVCALDMGASDFIAKPINPPLVKARVKTHLRLKHLTDELRHTAATDSLTGVPNRRQFDEALDREWQRSRRNGEPISLLLIDVDHFKLYNDRYGHAQGDVCLREVARALQGAARRTTDLVARCGGEEFAVLLPNTARNGAHNVSQRILAAPALRRVRHEASPTAKHVTVSIGIACYDESSTEWLGATEARQLRSELVGRCSSVDLLLAADRGLYGAKRAGRAQAQLVELAEVTATRALGPTESASRSAAPA